MSRLSYEPHLSHDLWPEGKKCILCICKNSNCKLFFFFPIFSHSLQLSMRFTIVLLDKVGTTKIIFHLMQKLSPSLSYHEENPFQNFLPMWSERHKSVMASSSLIKEQPNILKGSKNQGHHHSKHTWSIKKGYSNNTCSIWKSEAIQKLVLSSVQLVIKNVNEVSCSLKKLHLRLLYTLFLFFFPRSEDCLSLMRKPISIS